VLDGGPIVLANPINVTMDADHALSANFTEDVGDITPPTITINEPVAKDYLHSETLTLDFSAEDPSPPVSITATLDGEPVMNGDEIELYNLTLGSHIFQVTAIDSFGNSATETVPFEVIATVGSLQDLVTMFFESEYFHSPKGLYKSLIKKLYAAEAYIDAGKISEAKDVLGAFINYVEAKKKTGKLDEWAANILIADAEQVINNP
jgi:arabinoxylan arabinofuranohydrolase